MRITLLFCRPGECYRARACVVIANHSYAVVRERRIDWATSRDNMARTCDIIAVSDIMLNRKFTGFDREIELATRNDRHAECDVRELFIHVK